ncbi:hypothetical protein STRAU_2203 [Streptomyces aurantiacus JA 4570]|uniref:Uncharacterized protein n=1 Tax=Streptomyces aurantiacus JA 4570 TaxID=1286094 RepID=S4A1S0_9ACTN|nr:hypothetical protein STRAU_2203 [Streptomyces aurantiacus JA 4570]
MPLMEAAFAAATVAPNVRPACAPPDPLCCSPSGAARHKTLAALTSGEGGE